MELTFSEKVVGSVKTVSNITEEMVDDIMVGAIEGGINYWSYVSPITKVAKPKDLPTSTWCSKLLLDGKPVVFNDNEDASVEGIYALTLELLIKGCQKYADKRGWEPDSFDAESYDCIIQYALFGDIIYG